MPAKKTTTTKKTSTTKPNHFVVDSFISARLTINRKTSPKGTGDYQYELVTLHVDKVGNIIGNAEVGNIIGNAGCADVFICTQEELPALIDFLQSLVSK
jgi:hypothetical protein